MSGTFTYSDLVGLNRDAARFVERQGAVRFICDLTRVETVEISSPQLNGYAQTIAVLPAEQRIYVASDPLLFGLSRQYASHQRHAGNREPLVVETLDEAYRALGINAADFRPVA